MAAPNAGPPEPKIVPIPPDFPVRWDAPEEEKLPWQFDPMHFPDPMPRLEGELQSNIYDSGMGPAFAGYDMPMRAKGKMFNDYHYMAIFPVVPPEEMEAQGKKAEAALGAAMGSLRVRWEEDWLPEIQEHIAFWDAFDLTGATQAELSAHYDATLQRRDRLWRLHFDIVTPAYLAMGFFDELYKDLFAGEGTFSSYELLGGFDNKTLETDQALWDLSRKATDAEVRRILAEKAGAEALEALAGSKAGQVFLAELDAYLASYGQRGNTWSLCTVTWIEDPSPVLKNLRDYIGRNDADPRQRLATQSAEREAALVKVRQRLEGYPEPVRGQFEFLLQAAQTGVVLSEDHGFWIDFQSSHRVRMVLVEIGQRLAAAGVIEASQDVFHLGTDEVRTALDGLPGGDCKGVVAERKAQLEVHRGFSPPKQLGTDYGPPPDEPVSRAFGKFFGKPPEPTGVDGVLKGNAGSPGKVRGAARVVRSLDEAAKLGRGDILVTGTTSPPWTPLFATAGAIVTDTGGILSHCAVVAREYRIPAVVGTGAATQTIRDGQILEVDGDSGTVRVVD
jgi:phosphohistidine swiveling domain-containing protein